LTSLAIPLLQDLVNCRQANLTEDEKRVQAARKVASALKAKATRARNKEKTISNAIAAALEATETIDTRFQSELSVSSVPMISDSSTYSDSTTSKKKKPNTNDVAIAPTVECDHEYLENELFLQRIISTSYTWIYILKDDHKSFENLLTKVNPNKFNNNITTLGIIIAEKVIANRRPRDPRVFQVQMLKFQSTYDFSHYDLLITKCRHKKS